MKQEMRTIPPVVPTGWLENNMNNPEFVIVDIRSEEDYKTGHIPEAINVPFPLWITARDETLYEVPEEVYLFEMIGTAGISKGSAVVVVNRTEHPYPLADAARVAFTLLLAGIKNVAILDGGHNKWVKEGKPLSGNIVRAGQVEYKGEADRAVIVSKEYVLSHMRKSTILDCRDPAVYFGTTVEPTAKRAGHIPEARCLPAPWIWKDDGTYKDVIALRDMAFYLAGKDIAEEIIVYCGVGGYASAWWYVLTQLLGYRNIKVYDGSAQEWTKDPAMPLTAFRWD